MPTFNQQELAYRARNANSVLVMVGDLPVGFAQTTSHSFDFGTEQLYGIGAAKPQEVQQLRISPQITIDTLAMTLDGLTAFGNPANLAAILANQQFNLHVSDGKTGLPIFTYVGCVASNFSESIPANQPITDSITFMAMDVLDVTGQSILDQGSALSIPSLVGSIAAAGLGTVAGG